MKMLELLKLPRNNCWNINFYRNRAGCLGSLELESLEKKSHEAQYTLSKSQLLTCPEQAAMFIDLCPVDALAIAIGTSHGRTNLPLLDTSTLSIQTVKALHARLPQQHLYYTAALPLISIT